jgi:hypothetical protein
VNSNPIIVGGGIASGSPFTLGHLVYVTNTSPPQLSSFAPTVVTDSLSSVVYLNVPDSTNASVPTNQNATETFRVKGGIITEGAGTDSVAIGRGASAQIGTGANGADTILIGRGVIGSAITNKRVGIGALANISGGASVVIGYNAGSGSANPVSGVIIGDTAQASGNAGGATVVVIGENALAVLGNAGGGGAVVIGGSGLADHPGSVVVGRAAQASLVSTASQNTVTIGDGATSTKAGTTVVGGAASTTQTGAVVIGSGASATGASSNAIVIGQLSGTANGSEIIIGAGNSGIAANTLQLGGPSSVINTVVIGAGNTLAGTAAKSIRFTNASGSDNAAGSVTWQAPLSTGAASAAVHIFTAGVVGGSSSTLQTATEGLRIGGGIIAIGGATLSTSTACIFPASTTAISSMRIPSGTAPTSPVSGDFWYDGTNLKFRDGGTTRTITWV